MSLKFVNFSLFKCTSLNLNLRYLDIYLFLFIISFLIYNFFKKMFHKLIQIRIKYFFF